MDRRNFFKAFARGGIFAALAGTAVYLIAKQKPNESDACNFDFVCNNCIKNRHCQLPEASNYRYQNLQKK